MTDLTTPEDIQTAFCDAAKDTFDVFTICPLFNDEKQIQEAKDSIVYLQDTINAYRPENELVSGNLLWHNLTLAVHVLGTKNDHPIVLEGDKMRELSCTMCGKLLSYHDGYAQMEQNITNAEIYLADAKAIQRLRNATPQAR